MDATCVNGISAVAVRHRNSKGDVIVGKGRLLVSLSSVRKGAGNGKVTSLIYGKRPKEANEIFYFSSFGLP